MCHDEILKTVFYHSILTKCYVAGLAEAGLISSKLSRSDVFSFPEEDMGSIHFYPDR